MSLDAVTIAGTLKPDGSLDLDERPALIPGRVQVTLQPLANVPPRGGLAETIEEIRRNQQARGFSGRTPDEMVAAEALRREDEDEYERRMQKIWSQTNAGSLAGDA